MLTPILATVTEYGSESVQSWNHDAEEIGFGSALLANAMISAEISEQFLAKRGRPSSGGL